MVEKSVGPEFGRRREFRSRRRSHRVPEVSCGDLMGRRRGFPKGRQREGFPPRSQAVLVAGSQGLAPLDPSVEPKEGLGEER